MLKSVTKRTAIVLVDDTKGGGGIMPQNLQQERRFGIPLPASGIKKLLLSKQTASVIVGFIRFVDGEGIVFAIAMFFDAKCVERKLDQFVLQ